jgi:hypothetical protein
LVAEAAEAAYTVNLTLLGEPVGATLIAWTLPSIAETPSVFTIVGSPLILSGIFLRSATGHHA